MSADRLLSLSQAARMAGVTRKILQQHISCGDLSTFEGYVRMSDLRTVYPEVSGDRSGMIEKVRRIQDAAALKKCVDKIKEDPQRLANELHKAGPNDDLEVIHLLDLTDLFLERLGYKMFYLLQVRSGKLDQDESKTERDCRVFLAHHGIPSDRAAQGQQHHQCRDHASPRHDARDPGPDRFPA